MAKPSLRAPTVKRLGDLGFQPDPTQDAPHIDTGHATPAAAAAQRPGFGGRFCQTFPRRWMDAVKGEPIGGARPPNATPRKIDMLGIKRGDLRTTEAM